MTSSARASGHGTRRKVRERLGTATGGIAPGGQEWPPKDPQTSLRPTLDYRAEGYLLFCRLRAALRHVLFTGMPARTIALHLAPGDAPASVHTIIRELCAILDVEFGVTLAQDVEEELKLTSQVPPLRHELHRHFAAVLVPSDVKLSAFLRAHCDAEIALLPASPRHIAALVHRTTTRHPTQDLVLALSGLPLEHLHLVFRDRRSYADLIEHVERLQRLGVSQPPPCEASTPEPVTKPQQESTSSPPASFQQTVTLDDLFGMDDAVDWGKALVEDLKAWDVGELRWTDIDPGILLAGPPGTGKTLFARALANSASVHFEATSTATWQAAGHLNDTLKAMRKCFDKAKANAPAIVFVDELDAVGDRSRLEGHNASYDRQVINAFLECLDGIGRREGVVVIAATNAPEQLDAAILRSGRLDRVIRIAAPDRAARTKILKLHLGNDARNEDFDERILDRLVAPLEAFTGADIERLVRLARRRARSQRRALRPDDLISVRPPIPHPSRDELYRIAVHEAGHAVVAHVLGRKIREVRLRSEVSADGFWRAGVTETEVPDRIIETESFLKSELVILLAGHAAEEIILGDRSAGAGSGPESDLAQATALALRIEAGLGLGAGLSRMISNAHHAEKNASSADLQARVEAQLQAAYLDAKNIAKTNRGTLEAVAQYLTVNGDLEWCHFTAMNAPDRQT